MPEYITRDEWRARTPTPGPGELTPSNVEGIALHWPAISDPIEGIVNVSAALRSWQAFHMDGKGWSDIAYQEAIDQGGNVYRLRGLRVQSAANGDDDVNERFGALLLVVAAGETPSDELIASVRKRIARHRELFPNSTRIVGHREIREGGTECPGDKVQALVNSGRFEPTHPTPHFDRIWEEADDVVQNTPADSARHKRALEIRRLASAFSSKH